MFSEEKGIFVGRSQDRMHSIDILRAISALMVVLYHARAEFWQGGQATFAQFGLSSFRPDVWLSYASTVFSLGWIGVPIFFVLSGYCIHKKFAENLEKDSSVNISIAIFYWRRFSRIYPVYIAAMIFAGTVDFALQDTQKLPIWLAANAENFFLNAVMLQGLFTGPFGSNGVFWTLSIEFHLYLFYPVVFLIVRKYGPKAMILFAASLSIATAFFYEGMAWKTQFEHAVNGSPLFTNHLLIWAMGAYLAEIHVGRVRPLSGPVWTAIWIGGLLIGSIFQLRGFLGWSPILLAVGAGGVVGAVIPLLSRFCGEGSLVGKFLFPLGLASYSLYATHVPVFRAIQGLTGAPKADTVVWAIFCSAIAAAFSLIFYHLIERHTIRTPAKTNVAIPAK
jgi:peptidoglycan/LPS O-acetylase OafA/YrhL